MGLFNLIDPALDLIFRPLLNLGYLGFLIIMSFLISVGIILLTKYTTNQKLMKELRDSMKSYQDQMKEHKSNPSKVLELQKKAMEKNMEYMRHSFRTTIYSFIPIIILLGWVSSSVAYLPITPNEQFNATILFNKNFQGNITIDVPPEIKSLSSKTITIEESKATWSLKAQKEGDYELMFNADSETLSKEVIITNKLKYSPIIKRKRGFIDFIYGPREGYLESTSPAQQIKLSNKPTKPLGKISLFGWEPGWLGVYIISSIIFTMILREFLKVY